MEKIFINYYKCEECGEEWELSSDSEHEDECSCGCTMTPFDCEVKEYD